jgi:hypothetical protein
MIIEVTPPAAAARLAEAIVSRCSAARLADEDARIDEARDDELAGAVDDIGAFRRALVQRLAAGGGDAAHRSMTIEPVSSTSRDGSTMRAF